MKAQNKHSEYKNNRYQNFPDLLHKICSIYKINSNEDIKQNSKYKNNKQQNFSDVHVVCPIV